MKRISTRCICTLSIFVVLILFNVLAFAEEPVDTATELLFTVQTQDGTEVFVKIDHGDVQFSIDGGQTWVSRTGDLGRDLEIQPDGSVLLRPW